MSKKLKQMLAAYGLVLPSFLTVLPSITTNTFLKHRVN